MLLLTTAIGWTTAAQATTTINKQFTPATIDPGNISRFRITVANSSLVALTGAAVTDNLPANIKISSPANATNTCGFTSVTATPGASQIILNGGTVPAGTGTADGLCYYELDVVSTVAGNWINAIPKNGPTNGFTPGGTVSGFQATENTVVITNTTDAVATLSVRGLSPPTGSKTFSPSPGLVGEPVTLTIVLTNPASNGTTMPLTTFVDTLPAGMAVAPVPAASVVCTGTGAVNGAFSPNPGDTSLTLTGGTIGGAPGSGGTCTLSVRVLVNSIGTNTTQTFTNALAAGAIGNTRGLTSLAFSRNEVINSPVGLTKGVSPTSVGVNQNSVLTITITNASTATPLSITSLTDTLPPGLTVGNLTTNPATIVCAGTGSSNGAFNPSLVQGATSITIAGSVAGTTSSRNCIVRVPVQAAASGSYVNTIPANAVVNPGSLASPSATATLTVNSALTVAKSRSPTSVAAGQPTTFTVTINNWSAAPVSGVNFTDTLPLSNAGGFQMVLANPVNRTASAGCSGGTWSETPGASSITWTGGTITGGNPGVCTITFRAIPPIDTTIGRTFNNLIPANSICSGSICNTNAVSSGTVTVIAGASITKAFSPASVAQGQTSQLTVTLTNATPTPITGAALTDNLPTTPGNVVVAAVPGSSTTCAGGSVTASAGSHSVSIAGATIPASGSCNFKVNVTGSTVGTHTNTIPIGALTSTEGVSNPTVATANLGITTGITGTKSFSPTSVAVNGVSRVTVTVTNVSSGPLTGVSITDPLGANLRVASPANAATTCAGTPILIATPGANSASLTGAAIGIGGNCQFLFDVKAINNPTNWPNTIPVGNVTSAEGPANTAAISATLGKTATSIAINKSFDPVIVTGGQPSVLRIDITNPIGSPSGADNVTFTDTLPTGIEVYAVPNPSTTCTNGVVTAVPGAGSISLSGATLAANSTCSVFVTTTSVKFLNLINTIPVAAVSTAQGYTNSLATTATLSTLQGLGASKSFTPTSISAGQTATLKIRLVSTRDPNQPNTVLTGVSFTDSLPAGLTVAPTPNAATDCSGGVVTAAAHATQVTLAGATIQPNTNCLVQVDVTASGLGAYTNTIPKDAVTSNEGFKNPNDAVATLNVLNPPVITKVFSPAPVKAGQVSTLTVTVTNANAQTLNGVALTDNLPSGLFVATPPNASTTCSGGAVAAPVAGSSVALTNATLPAGGTCTFQANVVSNVPRAYVNTIPAGGLTTSQGVSNTAEASATLTVLQPPTVTKSFNPSTIDVGGTSLLTLTLGNPNTSSLTLAAVLTDALPGVVKVASPNNLGGTCTLGSVTAVPGSNTITYAAGATIPAGGCTIQVNVTSAQGGSNQNLIAPSSLSTNGGDNQSLATATLVVTAGSLGDRVWSDINGDGVQDSGEAGLNGVTVFLDTDNSGTLDPGEASAVTAGDGAYAFSNLPAGAYQVRIVPTSLPANVVPTYDLDGTGTANVANATLTAGQTLATVDFGYRQKPDLAVTKSDGVTAVNAGSTATYTITVANKGPTAANGALVTDPAAAGLVKTGTPACTAAGGAICPSLTNDALEGAGVTIDTLPSGGNLTITLTAQVTATTGSVTNTATAGLAGGMTDPNPGDNTASDTDTVTPVNAIGNTVWFDTNHDGIQDAAESGIAGMTVNLFDSTGTSLLAATQTDGSGLYRFDALAAGTYVVQFVPPAGLGYVASPANQGSGSLAASFDSNIDAASFKATVVLTNAADLTIDAGFYRPAIDPARLGDRVWYDTNQDGIQDSGEPGLGGVTVRLLDADNGNAVWATTVSDGNGAYEFTGLPAGNFVVDVVAPAGYTRSPLDAGGNDATDSDADADTGLTATIALAAGQSLGTVDAGLYLTGSSPGSAAASIGDFVWYDSNGNGIQDGEPGIPGVEVRLYDAAGTALLATTRTSATGAYGFSGLAAGSYTLAFVKPNAGYVFSPIGAGTSTTDSDADPGTGRVPVTLAAGETRTDLDAGLSVSGAAPISIGDDVWKDLNANHLPDSGEGLANAQVVLYDSLGFELARLTTTAADANYGFTGVPAGGSYRVAVDTSTVTALVQIADPDATLDHRTDLIDQAATIATVDFGYLTPNPAITIVKTAADDTDSQQIRVNGTAHFKIAVTNTGNVTLSQVEVTDALASDCNRAVASLLPGATLNYTCFKDTLLGSEGNPTDDFINRADVNGQPVDGSGSPVGSPVSAFDTSAVDVINPAVTILKTATTPTVNAGDTATFEITVTNTGDVALTGVAVTDTLAPNCAKTIGSLAVGAHDTWSCTLANLTTSVINVATVTGTPPVGPAVTATDDAYVNVVTPGLSIYKSPDTQTVRKGSDVTFTITVTNTGTADLTTIAVSDPNTPACNRTNVGPLTAGAHTSYDCTLTDVEASFSNTATATSGALSTSDVANVTVIDPRLTINKVTNDTEGPTLYQGTLVSWIYQVTNTGDVPLTAVGVTDDQGVAVSCPRTTLAVGEEMTCFAFGLGILGDYANIGTATASSPIGTADVTANDPSHYTGINPATIGNRVWLDENGDGVQDAGETGIANLAVQLRTADGAALIATTYTDTDGGYLFKVPAGTYQVRVIPASGLDPTFNEDTGTTTPDSQSAVTVGPGAVHLSADFGYNWVTPADSTAPAADTTGAIGDRVWNDSNGNGRQDPGESGIGGVTVTLTGTGADGRFGTADDPAALTRETDAAGGYVFDGLQQGVYSLAVTASSLPSGVTWTQTGDPDLGGPIDGQTTTPIVLAPGDVYVNADFGYQPAHGSSIGDTIYLDADANQAQDIGEAGIAGVTLALVKDLNSNQKWDAGEPVIATALTDANGQYLFTGLPAGDYTVVVTDTGNLLGLLEQSADPDAAKDQQGGTFVDGTADVLSLDFGYTPFGEHKNFDEDDGTIGDTVFLDRNGNGLADAGEGLQGVTVELRDSTGATLLATTATNANGTYTFGRLDISTSYRVVVVPASLPSGGAGLTNTVDPDTSGTGDGQAVVPVLNTTGNLNLLQDFGYRALTQPAGIGGTLWEDLDADGELDGDDEVGQTLANITVALRDSAGRLVAATSTDSSGNYLFSGLPAGTYTVDVTDTARLLEGWWHSLGTTAQQQPDVDNTSKADPFTLTVAAGETNTNADLGYYNQGAALGNRLWYDANGNGIQDGGEATGLGSVPVQLVITYPNSGGTTTLVAVTGSDGGYRFGNLLLDESYTGQGTGQPTSVISILTAPAGYSASPQGHGTSLTDSDNPAGTAATVEKGQTDTAVTANPASEGANAGFDFGYYSTGTVSGHLYIDTNGNGTQDSGEPNLADLDVIVTDVTGSQTVHSGADGNYSATVLTGLVTLDVDATDPQYPTGYTQTEGSDPTTVTATAGQTTDAGIDGYAPAGLTGTVSGHLYIDTDGNGAQGAGEPNLAYVDVLITDRFGGTQTVHSDGNGNYTATVPAGPTTADVQESDPDFPAGYSHTQGDDPSTATAVAGSDTSIGIDGYAPPASLFGTVSGHVYIDTNGNQTQDAGEPNVAALNVIVTDFNGGTQTVVTGTDGNWSATLVAGLGSARLDTADPQYPADYSQTEGDDPTAFTAIAEQGVAGGIDGFAPASTATVTGHLYIDSNGNGVQDPGEPNLPAVDVIITDVNGGTQRVTSDGNGDYSAAGVPAGSATVDVDNTDPQYPTGYTQTEGTDPTPVTVPVGGTVSAGNDGYQPPVGRIGNRVWLDEDGDGVQDAGEAGIANLKVERRDGTGNIVIATTYTDAEGGYLFADVPAGVAYQVRVTPTAGLNPTYDEDGIGSGSANLSAVASFPAGTAHLSADFGYNWVPPTDSTDPDAGATGAIGDRVWNDANGNGLQDPGEAGLQGVTVRLLTDTNGDGVYETTAATATTDGAGHYVFDGLTAAAYVVEVDSTTLPPNQIWLQTGDPDGGTADNRTTAPVILAPGDVYVNADFGYQSSAGSNIGDRVYLDANGNGFDDSNSTDPGIGGVSVALVKDTDGDHQWDAGEPIIATNLTDADGFYLFAGLSAGDYLVVVTDTADVLGALVQTGDPDGGNDGVSATSVNGVTDDLTQDHGYAPLGHQAGAGLIGDTLFLDRDGNGAFDAGEGLAGVTVELYAADGLTLLDTTVTNAGGQYAFGGLTTNVTYQVAVVTGTLPNGGTGLTNTVDPDTANPGNSRSSVTLTTGSPVDLAQDFGYTATSPNTIGGTLWQDTDADGTLNESGRIAGITVQLRDGTGELVGTTVTDSAGNYSFPGLPDGTYSVHVTDTSNLLDGWWKSDGPTAGADGNSQVDPYTVSVSAGATNTTADLGYYVTGAALGNRAWGDTDNDGLQDPTETGVSGAKVSLLVTYPNGDTSTVVTLTDGSGVYRFADLLLDESFRLSTAGTPGVGTGPGYRISAATAPAGYLVGTRIGQGDGKNDSDPHSGVTAAAIAQGDLDTALNAANPSAETGNAAYDFAYVPEGSLYGISGTVYNDSNGNGNLAERTGFGGTETALTGVGITVTLYTDPNGDGNPADGTVVGGPVVTTNGTYSFTGLSAGHYVVVETNPSGYVSTNDVDAPNDDRIAVVLTNASATAQDFLDTLVANSQLGSIAGQVRNDQNGDGNLATGTDPGLPNVTVELWIDSDSNGTPDSLYDTDTTDGSGNYSFANVPPGAYVVVEINLGGDASTNDVTAPNDDRIPLTLPNQGAITGRDFLDSETPNLGSIAGTVLIDGVGAGNVGDAVGGLADATVTLWTDPNGDGNPTDGVVYGSRTTGSPGTYAFTDLPVGSYVVVETNPSGYTSTNDVSAPNDDRIPVALPAGGTNVTGRHFLDATNGSAQVAAISGRVVNDANGNGDLNERGTEAGINGVTVTLYTDPDGDGDPSDGVVYSTTTTSGNGNYSFPAVPAGRYVVTETDPNGYTSTNDVVGANDNQVPVNRSGTTPVVNADFLDSQAPNLAAIGNRVWLDENSNGVQDAGEDGIANVTVELVDANDDVIATTATDSDGGYLFIGVPAGQHSVNIVTASLAVGLQPIADEDDPVSGTLPPATPHVSVVTVVGGAEHLSADFGYNWVTRAVTTTPPVNALGAIGDRVWDDANGNGVQDPGEAGLGNVLVRLLTDDNGDGVYGAVGDNAATTATTNAGGHYIFTGLPANAYVVEVQTVTLPNGPTWTQTGDPDGPVSTDSRTTTPVILAPGDVFVNADFGYRPSLGYTIGNRIWLDTNADGVDDGQTLEPGIAGVGIALLDAGGNVIATTVTDEYGEYAFPGLPAGTYSVVVTDTDHVAAELTLTGDPQGVVDGQSTVVLTNADNLDQDFGFVPPGQVPDAGLIGDTIFLDRNASGVAEAGEGLEGVTVRLYAANGTILLATTVTNEDGTYAFGGLNPTATYVVRVDTTTLPNGGTGLTNTVDPDGGAASQATRNLTSTGPIDLAADFGYRPLTAPNSITGMVWKDPNADGTRQSGETVRFGGVTVELRDANGDLVGTTVTAPNGTYSFANLPDGTYTVDVTDLEGVLNGTWHSLGTNSLPDPTTVTVNGTLGRTKVADFGYYLDGAALGNRVWKDANGDGIQQATETVGLGGTLLKLVITYPNGALSTVYTQSSATDGGYGFGDLLLDENFTGTGTGQPTSVLSVVTGPTGYTPSPINQGGYAATDSNNPSGTAATVVKGQTAVAVLANPSSESANATFDFGYIPAATSCSVICDVYPQTAGDGVVDMSDLTWINAHVKTKVTPAGAPHSGDCAKDGKLMVNDITACQAYLSP